MIATILGGNWSCYLWKIPSFTPQTYLQCWEPPWSQLHSLVQGSWGSWGLLASSPQLEFITNKKRVPNKNGLCFCFFWAWGLLIIPRNQWPLPSTYHIRVIRTAIVTWYVIFRLGVSKIVYFQPQLGGLKPPSGTDVPIRPFHRLSARPRLVPELGCYHPQMVDLLHWLCHQPGDRVSTKLVHGGASRRFFGMGFPEFRIKKTHETY